MTTEWLDKWCRNECCIITRNLVGQFVHSCRGSYVSRLRISEVVLLLLRSFRFRCLCHSGAELHKFLALFPSNPILTSLVPPVAMPPISRGSFSTRYCPLRSFILLPVSFAPSSLLFCYWAITSANLRLSIIFKPSHGHTRFLIF